MISIYNRIMVRKSELEEIRKLKRARQLGLTLEDMLKERIYKTGIRLQELQQERRKMENRIKKLESKFKHKAKI